MRQEVARAAADVKKWEQSAVEFAQLLERMSDPTSGLSEEYSRAATRMTDGFAKAFAPFGLQLVIPAAGDSYDSRLHDVVGEESHDAIPVRKVVRCIEWGVNLRGEITKAKVVLASRPILPPPAVPHADLTPTESGDGSGTIPVMGLPPAASNSHTNTQPRSRPHRTA
jgi:hypothetical protein